MELSVFFKSIVEEDRCAVVVCDTEHRIIYMNPAAQMRYEKRGGAALVGRSLMDCHNQNSRAIIERVLDYFRSNEDKNIVYTYHNQKENKDVYMVALRDENKKLVGYYEKHEYRDRESMKILDLM